MTSAMTMAEFRQQNPGLDSEFEWLSRQQYDFDPDDAVEIVEAGREAGGHLRLHGPGYAIQFSQGEPVVTER